MFLKRRYGQTVARIVGTQLDSWKEILMTDRAHLTFSRGVNKKNCPIWRARNPYEIHEALLHDQKMTVCELDTYEKKIWTCFNPALTEKKDQEWRDRKKEELGS